MFDRDLETQIRNLWREKERFGGFESAANAIDLQGRYGPFGSIFKNLLQPHETGEQALRKVLDTMLGCHDDWRICCHEAGHAIVAVKLGIVLEKVTRGEGTKGSVELVHDPSDHDDHVKYQVFYAGGAAAERIIFGTEVRTFDCIVDPLRVDKEQHKRLEFRQRLDGFEADICESKVLLERDGGKKHIESVANLLRQRRDESGKEGKLTYEEVAEAIGVKIPWL